MPGDNIKDTARLPSQEEIKEFYTENKNSLWYRLFMPAKLKSMSIGTERPNGPEPSSFYFYYKESFRWINFFNFLFGGFEIFNKLDSFRIFEEKDIDSNQPTESGEQQKALTPRAKVALFLQEDRNKINPSRILISQSKKKYKDISAYALGNSEIPKKLDDFTDAEIQKIQEIIDKLEPDDSKKTNTTNFAAPLLNYIINKKDHAFLSVLYYLTVGIDTMSDSERKEYFLKGLKMDSKNAKLDWMIWLSLAENDENKVKEFAELINKTPENLDLGQILQYKNLAIGLRDNNDRSYQMHIKEKNTRNKKIVQKKEKILTKSHWWNQSTQAEKEAIKNNLNKNKDTQNFLIDFCRRYGQLDTIQLELFLQISNLEGNDLKNFKDIVEIIQHKENPEEEARIIENIFSFREPEVQNTGNLSFYRVFGLQSNDSGKHLGIDYDSTHSDATTTSSNSIDVNHILVINEIHFILTMFKDDTNILNSLFQYNDISHVVQVINKILQINNLDINEKFQNVLTKLLSLDEKQIGILQQTLSQNGNKKYLNLEHVESLIDDIFQQKTTADSKLPNEKDGRFFYGLFKKPPPVSRETPNLETSDSPKIKK